VHSRCAAYSTHDSTLKEIIVPKERTGSVWRPKPGPKGEPKKDARGKELIYARVTFTDSRGKRQDIKRRARSEGHARRLIGEILKEVDDGGERVVESARMTFGELAEYYEQNYVFDAEYVEGRKTAGVRSPGRHRQLLKPLKEYFGRVLARSITTGDVERYKRERLATDVVFKNKGGEETIRRRRAVASVNRELSTLRRIFSVAQRERWVSHNPCLAARALISPADEVRRTGTITREEEKRLLAACEGKRAHLRAVIMCALDTGMRHGEIVTLRWSDVDFQSKTLTVRAFNTKTATTRTVGLTDRLAGELVLMPEVMRADVDGLVFGVEGRVTKGFRGAADAAGLSDVRFHDLRHTAATRLVRSGMPLPEVGRILGHSSPLTTYRYVNPGGETAARAADLLGAYED
jgi:integrase